MLGEMIYTSVGGAYTKYYTAFYATKNTAPNNIVCTDVATGVTFKPKVIFVTGIYNGTTGAMHIYYNADEDDSKFYRWFQTTYTSFNVSSSTTDAGITAINNNGFTINNNGINQANMKISAFG